MPGPPGPAPGRRPPRAVRREDGAAAALAPRVAPSPMPGSPIVAVDSLAVEYPTPHGAVHAVQDVSLSLRRGEILGLAGESGSGKSTLTNAITRLLRP